MLASVPDPLLDDLAHVHVKTLFPLHKRQNAGATRVLFSARGYEGLVGFAFPTPGARLVHVLDAIAVAWVALWIVLSLLVAREVRDLRGLSDTVVTAGVAIEETGNLVRTLGSVPFVGGRVGEVADRVETAGRSAQVSGRESRQSTHDLSVLLGLSIGLIPTLPLLGLYLPLRWTWTRESRAVRRALRRSPGDPKLLEFLARRAIATSTYDKLMAVSENPYVDLEEGRHAALAQLELARLGVRLPSPGPEPVTTSM
jgi:hypothetical protein